MSTWFKKGYKCSIKHLIHALIYSTRAIDADTGSPNMTTFYKFPIWILLCPNPVLVASNHLRLLCNTDVNVSSQSSFCHSALKQRLCIYRYQSINEKFVTIIICTHETHCIAVWSQFMYY